MKEMEFKAPKLSFVGVSVNYWVETKLFGENVTQFGGNESFKM